MSKVGEYVKVAKDKKNDLSEVMEKRKQQKLQQLEEIELDGMIAKAKKEIQESQATQQGLPQGQAQNLVQLLLAGRKPEEVKQILDSLDESHIEKLALITSTMGNNQLGALTQILRKPETSVTDTIKLIDTVVRMREPQQPQPTFDLKGVAEIFKAGVEAAKAQNPSTQGQQNPIETLKMYHETFVKPLLDQVSYKDKEVAEMRLRELESKIVNPVEYIKHIKATAQDLGLSPQGTLNEIALQLEKMKQDERLENKKIDWEMQKHQEEKDSQKELLSTVKDIFQGPVGKAIENIGGGAADRMRGEGKQPRNLPQPVRAGCPKCQKEFYTDPRAEMVVCPYCGSILQKEQSPQPNSPAPAEQPAPPPQPQAPIEQQPEATQETQPSASQEQQQPTSTE
jgi:DNA-directed RNA polymerase subunit RPC12/RpoP